MAEAKQQEKRIGYRRYWERQRKKFVAEGPKLADKANKLHKLAIEARRDALRYAKECGDALCEIRKYFPVKGSGPRKWKDWLSRNFYGPGKSYETVKVYMRISRKWNDPRIKAARLGELSPKSIAGFLRLLNYVKNAEDEEAEGKEAGKVDWGLPPSGPNEKDRMSMMRQELRRELFGEQLKRMTEQELNILIEGWDSYFWPKWYRDVRSLTSQVLKHNPYLLQRMQWVDVEDGPVEDNEEEINARMRRMARQMSQKRLSLNRE